MAWLGSSGFGATERRWLWVPCLAALLHLTLALCTQRVVLEDFPVSGDEYAYQVSSGIFARGRLSVPSPPLRPFFDVVHVVNDGRFYGKYPPGWPALLAVGQWAGVPWIVNPLLSAAGLIVVYVLTRRRWPARVANVAVALLVINPFVLFNAASYYSHTSCLLFLLLSIHFLFRAVDEPLKRSAFAWAGLCAGVAMLIRQYTTIAVLGVPAIHVLARLRDARDRRALVVGIAVGALPFAACIGVLLAYNHAQTGNAFLSPFELYAPLDRPGFPKDAAAWAARFTTHIVGRTKELERWFPLSPLLWLAAITVPAVRRDPKARVLAWSAFSLLVAFFFYRPEGGFRYGPRYVYEATGCLAIGSAAVLARLPRKALSVALAGLLVWDTLSFVSISRDVSRVVWRRKDLERHVAEAGVSNAIVFVTKESGPEVFANAARNGLDFDGSVLYVRDRGPVNVTLLRAYPDRSAYRYTYDVRRGRGQLVALSTAEPRILRVP